jgi:hypothetical protein
MQMHAVGGLSGGLAGDEGVTGEAVQGAEILRWEPGASISAGLKKNVKSGAPGREFGAWDQIVIPCGASIWVSAYPRACALV